MRALENNCGWNPIETAPLDKDVTLEVTDGRGAPYRLPKPCRRTASVTFLRHCDRKFPLKKRRHALSRVEAVCHQDVRNVLAAEKYNRMTERRRCRRSRTAFNGQFGC
jgi:hypothetical protein